MSDSKQILEGQPASLRTPTDDHVAELERLIHAACRLRRELRATDVPTISQIRDYRAAVASMEMHMANRFEGETVPS